MYRLQGQLDQAEDFIEDRSLRVEELEAALAAAGIAVPIHAALAPKGRSSYIPTLSDKEDKRDDDRRVTNWHPSTEQTGEPAGSVNPDVVVWVNANWDSIRSSRNRPNGWRSQYQAIKWYDKPENYAEWRRQVGELAEVQEQDKAPSQAGLRAYLERRGRLPDGDEGQDTREESGEAK